MELVSMKNKSSDREDDGIEPYDDEYPYGLRIGLSNDEIEKLSADGYKVGDEVTIFARATVKSKTESESEKESYKSMDLQITDMQLVKDSSNRTKKLYPDGEKS